MENKNTQMNPENTDATRIPPQYKTATLPHSGAAAKI
jgi:hypothetical protein